MSFSLCSGWKGGRPFLGNAAAYQTLHGVMSRKTANFVFRSARIPNPLERTACLTQLRSASQFGHKHCPALKPKRWDAYI
jgi:hypothetical protein